jgi:glycosyltransferase involved in cell wall biosynthesis
VGAEAASSPWLLFVDSDCRPEPDLLDAYFSAPIAADCGIVAGSVKADPGQSSLAARYARSRAHLDVDHHFSGPLPAGITANLLVRRAAWEGVGGFQEGIRSAGDVEFCWRAQRMGWRLDRRPSACVLHLHPGTVRRLREKSRRYGAGRRWLARRFAEAPPRPPLLRPLLRSMAGSIAWSFAGRIERARFKLIDGAIAAADARGWAAGDNRAGSARSAGSSVTPLVVATDAFPARSETFITNELLALRDLGVSFRVGAGARPFQPDRAAAREFQATYAEDEPPPQALRDLVWLVVRHPLRCLWDLRQRPRWRREEVVWPLRNLAGGVRRLPADASHVHVHFAALAALNAMRVARLAGGTYSIEAHGYDIFREPRNLPEKLERAAFATGTCDYTVDHLRDLVAPSSEAEIHRVVMGVDTDRFHRRRPYPGGRTVLAVGRYVEKKGFRHLIEATRLLRDRGAPLDAVVIAGSGPLRSELRDQIDAAGLSGSVELREADSAGVRGLLEFADLLAMPSVVAADGDRDSMPVVVKEALAMEVPAVASDAFGIPEMIAPEWGRLVKPGDPAALADMIDEVLALPTAERTEMGAAGRRFVREHCNVRTEADRLARLLAGVNPELVSTGSDTAAANDEGNRPQQ